jgi:uncharacterized membrane protein YciS (DUF1049 family)
MENSFILALEWILVFINFLIIILSLQSLSNKIKRIEEKIDKFLMQRNSL